MMLGAAGVLLIELVGGVEAEGADPAKPEPGRTIVAPIFKHGEGRGATGCVVIAPPVFLSEEEALQIIREELIKHGIKLAGGNRASDVVPLIENPFSQGPSRTALERRVRELKVPPSVPEPDAEAVDQAKKIAVRFVSQETVDRLGAEETRGLLAIYDFPKAAERVAAQLKRQGKTRRYVGVFYDPAVKVDVFGEDRPKRGSYAEGDSSVRAKAHELLREQSRDFVAWLKQQKAL
jgi:hypothetical protein